MTPLPTSARQRIAAAQQVGTVEKIQIRPGKGQPTALVARWDPTTEADHNKPGGDRAVTLIQSEHLAVIAQLLGRPAPFQAMRRNVLIKGFNLETARGQRLLIGDAVVELTERCHPCARMDENLGAGGFAAMFGHGGWCARLHHAATIRVGDTVRLVCD